MSPPLPESFNELLGGGLVVLGVCFSIVSLFYSLRVHCLKLLAICLVSGLSFLSGHPATYFAAIFIIATAVTELEFLQNLAAIIRGNKDYFDYKTQQLTSAQKKERLANELSESEGLNTSIATGSGSNAVNSTESERIVDRVFMAEKRALDFLEQKINRRIGRNLRFETKDRFVELDGIVDDGQQFPEIVEVKYIQVNANIVSLKRIIEQGVEKLHRYNKLARQSASLIVVFLLEGNVDLTKSRKEELERYIKEANFPARYFSFTTKQLGL